jgi:hypothetical protein
MRAEVGAEAAIAELHVWYGERTGVNTKLCFAQRLWFELLRSYGYRADLLKLDAEIVIRHLKSEIAREKRNIGALKPVNFLQPDNFDADLAIARVVVCRRLNIMSSGATKAEVKDSLERPVTDEERAEKIQQLRDFRKQLRGPQ